MLETCCQHCCSFCMNDLCESTKAFPVCFILSQYRQYSHHDGERFRNFSILRSNVDLLEMMWNLHRGENRQGEYQKTAQSLPKNNIKFPGKTFPLTGNFHCFIWYKLGVFSVEPILLHWLPEILFIVILPLHNAMRAFKALDFIPFIVAIAKVTDGIHTNVESFY